MVKKGFYVSDICAAASDHGRFDHYGTDELISFAVRLQATDTLV